MMVDQGTQARRHAGTQGATSRDREGAVLWKSKDRSLMVAARRGYSFPEVMFAVVVLGIGFIMLAAIFPVAVKQTKATMDQTQGMSIARSAVGIVTGLADGSDASDNDFYAWAFNEDRSLPPKVNSTPPQYWLWNNAETQRRYTTNDNLPLQVGDSLFPATGVDTGVNGATAQPWFAAAASMTTYPPSPIPSPTAFPGRVFPVYTQKGWDALRGSLVSSIDSRYAWTLLYSRDGNPNYPPSTWSPVMEVYIIVARVQSRTNYNTSPDGTDMGEFWTAWNGQEPPVSSFSTANLYPRFVKVDLVNDYQNSSKKNSDGPGPDELKIDSSDKAGMSGGLAVGTYVIMQGTGKVYELGPQISSTSWELVPGHDMADSSENTTSATGDMAMFLGRERTYDTSSSPKVTGHQGPAQDVYVYTAVVPIGKS